MCVIPSISLPSQMTWNLNEWRNTCWSLIKTSAMYFQPCPARHLQSNFQKHWFACPPFVLLKEVPKASTSKCINMPHMDTYWWFNYGSKSKTRKATGLSLCLRSINHPISSNYWGYPTLENTFLGPRSNFFWTGHFSWTLLNSFGDGCPSFGPAHPPAGPAHPPAGPGPSPNHTPFG